jgi:multiple sugar transport system substrate-binding protein
MTKKWVGITVMIMLVSLLAACAGGESNSGGGNGEGASSGNEAKSNTDGSAPKKDVKLTMSVWSEARVETYQALAEEYKALNPHVSVEVMSIPFADYQQKLSIMAASKTAPDIAWLAERMAPQFLKNDQLLDISSYVQDDPDYDFADIIPSTLEIFQHNGGLYGIPFSTPPHVIFYNKTMFESKGLKTPLELFNEGNWTYEELQKTAAALSDPNQGVFGATFGVNTKLWSDYLFGIVWAMGGEVFNEDMSAFTLNSEIGVNVLNYYKQLLESRSHPSIGSQITFDGGKLGMSLENVTNTSKYRDKVDFDWDIAPVPTGAGGHPVALGFAGYSVFKSEQQEEAAKFIKFLTNKENASTIADFFVPQRKSILNSDDYLNLYAHPSAETMKVAAYDRMDNGRIRPGHPNWVQIDEQIAANFDAFLTGIITAEEALKLMEQAVNPLLK